VLKGKPIHSTERNNYTILIYLSASLESLNSANEKEKRKSRLKE